MDRADEGCEVGVARRAGDDQQGGAAEAGEPVPQLPRPAVHAPYRFRSMKLWKADLGMAPIMRSTICPPLNRMKVGMLETWYW